METLHLLTDKIHDIHPLEPRIYSSYQLQDIFRNLLLAKEKDPIGRLTSHFYWLEGDL